MSITKKTVYYYRGEQIPNKDALQKQIEANIGKFIDDIGIITPALKLNILKAIWDTPVTVAMLADDVMDFNNIELLEED